MSVGEMKKAQTLKRYIILLLPTSLMKNGSGNSSLHTLKRAFESNIMRRPHRSTISKNGKNQSAI